MRSARAGARVTALGRRSTLGQSERPRRYSEQDRAGPSSRLPKCSTQSSVISNRSIFRDATNVPFVLPQSSANHAPRSVRSTAWFQDTRMSSMTMSDRGSRPTRHDGPGRSVFSVPWISTTSIGPAACQEKGPVIGLTPEPDLAGRLGSAAHPGS